MGAFASTPTFELFRRGLEPRVVKRFHGINAYKPLTQLGPDWAQDSVCHQTKMASVEFTKALCMYFAVTSCLAFLAWPVYRAVTASVCNFEVLKSVIQLVLVDVMNNFRWQKRTLKVLFGYHSMLQSLFAIYSNQAIAFTANCAFTVYTLLSFQWMTVTSPQRIMCSTQAMSVNEFCATFNSAGISHVSTITCNRRDVNG